MVCIHKVQSTNSTEEEPGKIKKRSFCFSFFSFLFPLSFLFTHFNIFLFYYSSSYSNQFLLYIISPQPSQPLSLPTNGKSWDGRDYGENGCIEESAADALRVYEEGRVQRFKDNHRRFMHDKTCRFYFFSFCSLNL